MMKFSRKEGSITISSVCWRLLLLCAEGDRIRKEWRRFCRQAAPWPPPTQSRSRTL
jgi:hypothetical protein